MAADVTNEAGNLLQRLDRKLRRAPHTKLVVEEDDDSGIEVPGADDRWPTSVMLTTWTTR